MKVEGLARVMVFKQNTNTKDCVDFCSVFGRISVCVVALVWSCSGEDRKASMSIVGEGSGSNAAAAAMEVEAFKRLYPLQFYERYLDQSVRPDGRPLNRTRPTSVALGSIPTAEGSALVKIGHTTMLAGVKLEVMVPSTAAPDQGQLVVDFQMPTICSPLVRPGRPAEVAWVVSEQLSNALSSSNFVNLQQLCIVPGKAAWIAYVDVYCLDADGSLLDAALLAAVAALTHLQLPAVKVTEGGRVVPLTSQNGDDGQEDDGIEMKNDDQIVKSRQRLERRPVPIALTCVKHKTHLLADPSAEEESTLQTSLTVVMDSSDSLVSFYKPGGAITATSATVKDCIDLAKKRVIDVKDILDEAYEEAFETEMMDCAQTVFMRGTIESVHRYASEGSGGSTDRCVLLEIRHKQDFEDSST